MNGTHNATRIVAGVLPAMALFATTASAQELRTQTTPPPVPAQAAPAPTTAAPAAASSTASPDAQARYQASLDAATGSTAAANAPAAAEPAARTTRAVTPSSTASRTVRSAPVAVPAAAAPVAAAPAAPASPAVTASPAAEAAAPAEAAPEAPTEAQTTQTTTSGTPTWAWLIGGLAAIAAIALGIFALRRRREEEVEWVDDEQYVEPAYVEPAPLAAAPLAAAPLGAAPLAADEPVVEHAEVVDTAPEEVAEITAAAAPVAGRPWIELSLRPVRAGATDDAALVDLELTLANAGEVAAQDVRVSTFMLGDAAEAPTEMERLLATGHAGATVDAGSIGAGEGSRVDARLAIPREEMEGATFQPVVVADVRYALPGGGEGRTAAAFTVGVYDDTDTPTPLRLGGDMREDVAATLHGVPERA